VSQLFGYLLGASGTTLIVKKTGEKYEFKGVIDNPTEDAIKPADYHKHFKFSE